MSQPRDPPSVALFDRRLHFAVNWGEAGAAAAAAEAAGATMQRVGLDIGLAFTQSFKETLAAQMQRGWERWLGQFDRQARGVHRTVGFLEPDVQEFLQGRGIQPQHVAVTISDERVVHILGEHSANPAATIAQKDLARLPSIIANPQAVLFDTKPEKVGDGSVLYVYDAADGARGAGKFVVRINYPESVKTDGPKIKRRLNSVRTAGLVQPENLRDRRYLKIRGDL